MFRFNTFLDTGKHRIYRINNLQNCIHQFCIDGALSSTQNIKYVFRFVTDFNQGLDVEEAGTAFNRMETTENGIKQVWIFRRLLKIHQLLIELFENFTALYKKVLKNLIIQVKSHLPLLKSICFSSAKNIAAFFKTLNLKAKT